ncbi:MAG: hypothetical protein WCK02_02010 [Bacteroidota bacterium]
MKTQILVICLLIMIIFSCTNSNNSVNQIEKEKTAEIISEIQKNALDLCNEYEQNEAAADLNYKDKLIVVNGKVEKIGKDIMNNYYVLIEANNNINVQCLFNNKDISELSKLKKGTEIKIKGKCFGKMLNIIIRECCVIEQ